MNRFDKPFDRPHGSMEHHREHLRVGICLTKEGRAEMSCVDQVAALPSLSCFYALETFRRLCDGPQPRSAMARPGERLLALEMDPIPADLASARRSFLAELCAQGVPAGTDLLRGWVDASPKIGEALASGNSG